jgi:hypothetical protein
MVDKVRPLKQESPSLGGTEDDFLPTATDPAEDYLSAKGIAFTGSDNTRIGDNSGAIEVYTNNTLRTTWDTSGGLDHNGHTAFGNAATINTGIANNTVETVSTATDMTGVYGQVNTPNTNASSNGFTGGYFITSTSGASAKASTAIGIISSASWDSGAGASAAGTVAGGFFSALHSGSSTVSNLYGSRSSLTLSNTFGSPVATNAYGQHIELDNTGGSITAAYGLRITCTNNTGTATTGYGLYIDNMSGFATTTYGLAVVADSSFFTGGLKIGGASAPSYTLDVTGTANITGALTLGTALGATSGGTSQSTYTTGDLLYSSATNTLSKLAIGATSRFLQVASGVPSWSSYTLPSSVGATGTILRSDGTNFVASTVTWPNSVATGTLIYTSSTNTVSSLGGGSSGKILRFGASLPAWSTATFPNTTTANQILYSSATNTVSEITTANTSALITNSTGVPSFTSGTTANRLLRTNGTTISFAQADLTTDVTGVLPAANGGVGGFTAGSIPFSNGTSLTENNSKLFWSDTLGKLGLGTSSPSAYLHVSPVATTGTVDPDFKISGASHTSLGASVERNVVRIDPGTQSWSAGSLTNQRAIYISQPTVAFSSSSTNSTSATVYIAGNPIEGTNCSITDAISLWIDNSGTSPVTNTYGIFCKANQSATGSRYSGHFEGGQFILKDASSTVGKILRCMTSTNTEFFTVASTGINCEGTTLYGNDTSSGHLTLESTSDATKGYVRVNSSIQMGGTYKFLFQDNSSNFITIQPPGTITTHSLTLPASQGAADSYLKNDGSGGLTWSVGPGAIKAYALLGAVNGVGGSATSDAPFSDAGAYAGFVAIAAGTVEAITINMSLSRTAGTCIAKWLKNGVVQSGTVTIDGTNTTTHRTTGLSVAYAAGDVITLQTVTSSFTPTGSDAQITLFIKDS